MNRLKFIFSVCAINDDVGETFGSLKFRSKIHRSREELTRAVDSSTPLDDFDIVQ